MNEKCVLKIWINFYRFVWCIEKLTKKKHYVIKFIVVVIAVMKYFIVWKYAFLFLNFDEWITPTASFEVRVVFLELINSGWNNKIDVKKFLLCFYFLIVVNLLVLVCHSKSKMKRNKSACGKIAKIITDTNIAIFLIN